VPLRIRVLDYRFRFVQSFARDATPTARTRPMLQRRTFLGLLAGIAGSILALTRALRPSSWWKRPARFQAAPPMDAQSATPTENQPGIKITTVRRWTFRNSLELVNDSSTGPDIFYLQGEWRRIENHGPRIVSILRPDLGQMFELNLDASEYTQMSYPPSQELIKKLFEAPPMKMPSEGEPAKPTFRIETVTKDTGERKEMFGYLARHVIITQKEIPLEGSRRQAQETTTDGWYIDLEAELHPSLYSPNLPSLYPNLANGKLPLLGRVVHAYLSVSVHRPGKEPEPPEKPEFIDIGEPETGFALQKVGISRGTVRLPDGSTRETEQRAETVVTIEKGTYDVALFEVPAGFKRIPQINRNPAYPNSGR